MEGDRIKVFCVDDSPDIAGLLEIAINCESDMQSVGCLHDAGALLGEVDRSRPDIVILDLTMPGRDPIEVIRQVRDAFPETRVIVYSGYDDAAAMDKALEAGAWGFVSKHREMAEVIQAIRQVAGGELVMDRQP